MNRPRPKGDDRPQETEQSSQTPAANTSGSPAIEYVLGPDASQCLPYSIPSLPIAANYPVTNTDYLLLSLAGSNRQATHMMSQPLYTNAMPHALPFFQDNTSQPLVALRSNYAVNPYVYVPTIPVYQQPMQFLIDPTQSLHQSLYSPGHFHGLANGIQASYAQPATLCQDMTSTLMYVDLESEESKIKKEESQRASEVTTSSDDNEASSALIKCELVIKPKRPLSAYNLFFREQRHQLIQNDSENDHDDRKRRRSGISFENLAKEISERWRNIDAKTLQHYDDLALTDKERYQGEMERFKEQQDSEMTKRRMDLESTVPEATMELYMKAQAKKPKKRNKLNN